MAMFRRIDDFLFDRVFQPIVDRFPDQGPVGVARFIITGSAMFFVASGALDGVRADWLGVFFTVLWLGVCAICYLAPESPRLGTRNVFKLTRSMDRAFAAFLLALAALGSTLVVLDANASPIDRLEIHLFNAGIVLRWAYEYAVACDVRPPKARKTPFWQSPLRPAPRGA